MKITLESWVYPFLLIALAFVVLTACGENREEQILKAAKFQIGDIIHYKPDSLRGVVIEVRAYNYDNGHFSGRPYYRIEYKGGFRSLEERMIYDKPKPITYDNKEF